MTTLFLVFAIVGAILLSITLALGAILVTVYRIISEQDEIIREYEELILKLEEGEEK